MLREYFVPAGQTVTVLNPFVIVRVLFDTVTTQEGAEGKVELKLVQELWEKAESGIEIVLGNTI